MKESYPNQGQTVVRPVTDNEMAEKVSALVIPFSRKQLSKFAARTPEAAKKWQSAKSAPSLATAINLARKIPEVKWLIYSLIEQGEETLNSTRFNTELVSTLLRISAGNDQSSLIARAALLKMHEGRE